MIVAYRESAPLLLCPRCGEILEDAFDGVMLCVRCEGIWLPVREVVHAFGDRQWPEATSMWWRNQLECPWCTIAGERQTMSAAMVGSLLIDRCARHGLWLDRGELGRLMQTSDQELVALAKRLHHSESVVDSVFRRRDELRDAEQRREQASLAQVALLAARREAAERAERLVRERERAVARGAAERSRIEAERSRAEAIRQQQRMEVRELRDRVQIRVTALERELVSVREELATKEQALREVRHQLATYDRELDALDSPAAPDDRTDRDPDSTDHQ